MFTQAEEVLLRAVIDRLIPADAFASATGFGADHFILAILQTDAAARREAIRYGLNELGSGGFLAKSPAEQDAALTAMEGEPWFAQLVELTAEGAFADPDNGGNRDAASWDMLGYDPRLPDGPTGPPQQPDPPAGRYGASGVTDWDVIIVGAGVTGCAMAASIRARKAGQAPIAAGSPAFGSIIPPSKLSCRTTSTRSRTPNCASNAWPRKSRACFPRGRCGPSSRPCRPCAVSA